LPARSRLQTLPQPMVKGSVSFFTNSRLFPCALVEEATCCGLRCRSEKSRNDEDVLFQRPTRCRSGSPLHLVHFVQAAAVGTKKKTDANSSTTTWRHFSLSSTLACYASGPLRRNSAPPRRRKLAKMTVEVKPAPTRLERV